jgi:hypothetical protein
MTSKPPMAASEQSTKRAIRPGPPTWSSHWVLDLREEANDPSRVVDHVDDEDRKLYGAMSKADIKSAPDINDEDRHVRDPYDTYYEPFGRRT